jgi:hypothetical protein
VILATPLDEAWATLSTLAPARGTLAGHTGTAMLEEADDDTHTARLRLQGVGPNGPVTATVTATLEPVGAGTRLHLATRTHPNPPRAEEIEAIARVLAAALTARAGSDPQLEAAAGLTPSGPSRRARWVAASLLRRHK